MNTETAPRLPAKPSRALLRAMQKATFLNDRSTLEMHRRYNGLREWLLKYGKKGN